MIYSLCYNGFDFYFSSSALKILSKYWRLKEHEASLSIRAYKEHVSTKVCSVFFFEKEISVLSANTELLVKNGILKDWNLNSGSLEQEINLYKGRAELGSVFLLTPEIKISVNGKVEGVVITHIYADLSLESVKEFYTDVANLNYQRLVCKNSIIYPKNSHIIYVDKDTLMLRHTDENSVISYVKSGFSKSVNMYSYAQVCQIYKKLVHEYVLFGSYNSSETYLYTYLSESSARSYYESNNQIYEKKTNLPSRVGEQNILYDLHSGWLRDVKSKTMI